MHSQGFLGQNHLTALASGRPNWPRGVSVRCFVTLRIPWKKCPPCWCGWDRMDPLGFWGEFGRLWTFFLFSTKFSVSEKWGRFGVWSGWIFLFVKGKTQPKGIPLRSFKSMGKIGIWKIGWLVASNMVFSSTDHVTPFGVTFGGAYRSVPRPVAGHCSSTGWQYVGTEKGEGFTGSLSDVRYPMILPMITKYIQNWWVRDKVYDYNTYIYIYMLYMWYVYIIQLYSSFFFTQLEMLWKRVDDFAIKSWIERASLTSVNWAKRRLCFSLPGSISDA